MPTPTPTLSDSSAAPRVRRHARALLAAAKRSAACCLSRRRSSALRFFYLLPTIRAFYIGLTNWSLLRAPKWVGLDNYIRLFQDEKFWKSIWVTFLYVVYNIPIQTVLGLLIAVLLKRLTGSVFVRSVMLTPFLISNVIAAMIWFYMFDPVLGFVNVVLKGHQVGKPRLLQRSESGAAYDRIHQRLASHGIHGAAFLHRACSRFPSTSTRRPALKAPRNGGCFARSPCRSCGPCWSLCW